jgi:hypothetical protein
MTRSIESQLNESYRDALVEYYLSEVVPNHVQLVQLGLDTRLKTANDLYEYFLIDNQVSNDVQTSPVASAIASLQQYINGTLLGMEPGYTDLRTDDAQFVEWKDRSSQYPIWAANQQLALYPEIYISPELRLKKSMYFSQLENDINQNKISIDTTQEAVKHYLASFEEVANLTIINGYIDSGDFAIGKYYFIGKSRAEEKYYWRSVDMNERAYLSGTEGAKHDEPTPGAWSDWKRAELGISANTLERTIRPVFFNNRLFVVWVDLIHIYEETSIELELPEGEPPYPQPAPEQIITTPKVQLLFNISYKKYDDSWSAPQIYLDVTRSNNLMRSELTLETELNSIAIFDASSSPESLFIAMYAGEELVSDDIDGSTSKYQFLKTGFIDKNFNFKTTFPVAAKVDANVSSTLEADEVRIRKSCWAIALKNKQNFQFLWHTRINFKTVETQISDWNYGDQQNAITEINKGVNAPIIYHERSTIGITTAMLDEVSVSGAEATTVRIAILDALTEIGIELTLKIGEPIGAFRLLNEGSTLTLIANSRNALTPGASINFTFTGLNNSWDDTIRNFLFSHFLIPELSDPTKSLEGGYIRSSLIEAISSGTLISTAAYLTITTGSDKSVILASATFINETPPPDMLSHYIGYHIPEVPGGDKDYSTISYQNHSDHIPAGASLTAEIEFDKDTLLPLANWAVIADTKAFQISHGAEVGSEATGSFISAGRLEKLTKIELTFETDSGADLISPKISTRAHPQLGIAEYIDFTDSSIQNSDDASGPRNPIRMNTLFARELINKANIALEALLSWGTQQLLEPPIGDQSESPPMDFKGANGLYFWELFLHLPFMISHRLTQEKKFSESDLWLGFIFDPARKASDGAPAYWNVRPLVEVSDPDYFLRAPIDPDGIAASDPVRYQKAIYSHYIKNLIARGDMAYRQLTPDSLNEAKLWYVRVLDLLGPRPDTRLISRWTPLTLQALADATSPGLRAFETKLVEQEQQMRISANENGGKSLISFKQPPLRLSTFGRDPTLMEEDNDKFIPPMNSELVMHWDTVESRLYNLRHNFTLDGKPLQLPLFAAPLDPRALLAAYANGGAGGGAGSLLAQEVPHFRYAVMAPRASMAVETLIQFGNTLLSILERKDQAEYLEIQQQMAWDFSQFAIDLQLETQKVEVMARESLEASKAIADARGAFYGKLASENVSPGEISAMALQVSARVYDGVSAISEGIAAMLKPVPGDFGLHAGATGGMAVGAAAGGHVGGVELEGIPEAVAIGSKAIANVFHSTADVLEKTEQYRRRLQEWENMRDQANLESDAITAQLAVHDAQIRVTVIQLRQAEEAKNQAEKMYAFLKSERFSNSQLYQWLTGQFSTLYYQAYDATVSLCLAAQACWQYERADFVTSFIKPSAWNDTYRGLLSGESLKLDLLRMDAAFLSRHERLLEIVKTVSVRQLPPSTEEALTLNREWAEVVTRLTNEGAVEFEITQAMLDDDYPDQTLRRIKRISVSLPVTVGPYQDIRAILTQSYNAVQIGATLKENMRASQQIAVSTGVDDDGLFVFNFDDERYLPFEGTGAISRWRLDFPHFDGSQKDMIDSITDIIVHIRYTAKAGSISPGKSIKAPSTKRASKKPSI